MKNLLLGFCLALFVAVGMSSCAAEVCYTCTHASSTGTAEVCGGSVTGSDTFTNGAAAASNAAYSTNDAHKNYLESIQFTCTQK